MKHLGLILLTLFPLALAAQRPVVENLGDWLPQTTVLKGSMQGMAVQGHKIVTLRHGGQCVMLDLRHKNRTKVFQLADNTTHCNNASFSAKGKGSRLPLLYISSCYGDKACLVTSISDSGSAVVQRIFYDSECFPVAQDWCVDADNGFLYAFGGRRGETMYLKQFRLPKVDTKKGCSDIHLTDKDVLDVIPINCVKVAQGSKIQKGLAYLPDGDKQGDYFLHILDLNTGQEIRTIDLNAIGLEPEGVDVRGRWIYISFNTAEPAHNKIYRFHR